MELRHAALQALLTAEPAAKAAAALALHPVAGGWVDTQAQLNCTSPLPGRTGRPVLVEPGAVQHRSPFTPDGRAALLHAVAHIELNAIKMLLLFSIPYRGTRRDDALQLAEGRAAG